MYRGTIFIVIIGTQSPHWALKGTNTVIVVYNVDIYMYFNKIPKRVLGKGIFQLSHNVRDSDQV